MAAFDRVKQANTMSYQQLMLDILEAPGPFVRPALRVPEGLARAAKVGRCHKRYELKTGRNEPLARLGPGTAEARRARSRPAPKRKMAPNVDVPLFGYCGALESENHSASLFTPCKTQCEPCSAICNLEK